jgi:hypothetical protein
MKAVASKVTTRLARELKSGGGYIVILYYKYVLFSNRALALRCYGLFICGKGYITKHKPLPSISIFKEAFCRLLFYQKDEERI